MADMKDSNEKKVDNGGRNLIMLGVLAVLIALVTTTVSLIIYHNSGDIYLDRSRPGFLPDEDETKSDDVEEEDYIFSRTGKITGEVLDELLKNLDMEIQSVDFYDNPFDEESLSDERLGIPEAKEES